MKLLERKSSHNGSTKGNLVRTPTVLQMEAVECGAASLGMILGYYGRHVPLEELRVACGVTRDGSSAGNLLRAARAYGLDAHGYRYEVEDLKKTAAAVHHLLAVLSLRRSRGIHEGRCGSQRSRRRTARLRLGGVRSSLHRRLPDVLADGRLQAEQRRSVDDEHPAGAARGLVGIGSLRDPRGFALVIPGIALPTLTKTFIDEVLVGKSYSWVFWITAGIFASIVLEVALLELQQHAIVRLQAKLALANASRMLWHVVHLPMTFFAQRSPAEVANRVAICDRVAELLSSRLAASAIGVVAALFYLALMARYDQVSCAGLGLHRGAQHLGAAHRRASAIRRQRRPASRGSDALGKLGLGTRANRNAQGRRRGEHVFHEVARPPSARHQRPPAFRGAVAGAQRRAATARDDQRHGDPDPRRTCASSTARSRSERSLPTRC